MIIIILLLALVLRLVNLNQSLWLDEAVQAITAKGSFSGIFTELIGDFHPPFTHILLWGWGRIFGFSEVSLRMPSAIFGVLTVWMVYLIARSISSANSKIPLLVSLFLATAPFHIYYSQEARMYSVVTFFSTLSTYYFFKNFKDRQTSSIKILLPYIFSTTLMLYGDYFGILVVGGQLLAAIILLKKNIGKILPAYFLIILLFLPCLPLLRAQIANGISANKALSGWGALVNLSFIKALPMTFVKFSIGRITIFDKKLYTLFVGVLFAALGFIFYNFLRKRKSIIHNSSFIILLCCFFVPLIIAWMLSIGLPSFQPFRLLLILPAFYLILGVGAMSFRSVVIKIGAIVFILAVNLLSITAFFGNPYFHREDWRGVSNYLEKKAGVTVILPSETSNWPLRYYSMENIKLIGVVKSARVLNPDDIKNNLTVSELDVPDIYYIRYLVALFDPYEQIDSWLRKNGFVKINEISFNQIPVWEYQKTYEDRD